MLSAKIILEQLEKVKPQLQKQFNVNEIALFGSYARNEQTENSDIDVLVNLQPSSYINLCNTLYTLQNLFPNQKIQIVSKKGIKPKYFEFIKNDLMYA
jgi:predicted nucleotidyltransferase